MPNLKAYLAATVAFLVVDIVWISLVAQSLYDEQVPHLLREAPDMIAAAAFYVAYIAGIVYLAVRPALAARSIGTAVANGAVLGAVAYGTFTVTNYAILDGWTAALVWTDIPWGAFLTATTAACAYWAETVGSDQ